MWSWSGGLGLRGGLWGQTIPTLENEQDLQVYKWATPTVLVWGLLGSTPRTRALPKADNIILISSSDVCHRDPTVQNEYKCNKAWLDDVFLHIHFIYICIKLTSRILYSTIYKLFYILCIFIFKIKISFWCFTYFIFVKYLIIYIIRYEIYLYVLIIS